MKITNTLAPSALVVCLLTACAPRNEFQPPPPPMVTVAMPLVDDITVYQNYPGRLEAVETVEMRARVTGYLKAVSFKDGERVKKGQLLFQIEPEAYEAAVQSAEAALAQAKASESLARTSLERKRLAFKTQAVSELDVLAAEADLEVASASIRSAQAVLDDAKLSLSYTKMHSPIDGRIARHQVSVGNLVSGQNATLLSTIVSEDPIHCYVNINERTYMKHTKQDGINSARPDHPDTGAPPVKLELANGELYPEEGVVDFIDNQFDNQTATLTVRARFANGGAILAPGMFGRVKVPENLERAVLVPELSVQRDMSGPFLYLVGTDRTVERRSVTLGPLAGEMRVIEDGLQPKDTVVIKGLQKVREGIQVQTTVETLSLSDS